MNISWNLLSTEQSAEL